MDIVERLDWLCTDWDRSQMVDGEPPLDDVRVGDLRKAAAEITRLRKEIEMTNLAWEKTSIQLGWANARLAEAEAAKADAWDEGYWTGHSDGASNRIAPDNPCRSKTDD